MTWKDLKRVTISKGQGQNITCDRCHKKLPNYRTWYYEYRDECKRLRFCRDCYNSFLPKINDPPTTENVQEKKSEKPLFDYDENEGQRTMINEQIERTSFCRVGDSLGTQKWIYRLADIEDGVLTTPFINEEAPKIFDNRTRLFWRNGPSTDGAFGVWDWVAIPNKKNPDTDYIETDYTESVQVIEIFEIPEIATLDKLVNRLSAGIPVLPVSPKVFFCFQNIRGLLTGVLCDSSDIRVSGNQTILSEETQSLPAYDINLYDTLSLEGRLFYKRLSIEGPEKKILVKEPVNIVRDIIIRRTSWSAVKPLGVTKKTWRSIRELIEETPAETIYQEVASACHCNDEEAKTYVSRFVDNVESYISQDNYDSEVLVSVLEGHPAIMQKCESIVSERWKATHVEEIGTAKKELNAIVTDIEEKQSELRTIEERLRASENRLAQVNNNITDQEKLADSVSEKVKRKITEARSDAASFIAEMAFVSPPGSGKQVEASINERAALCPGDDLDPKSLETNRDWKETIETLRLELTEAGVAEEHSTGLASFLYAAFINRTPILLAGPYGGSIADAFSSALFGKTAEKLDCSAPYHSEIYKEINESTDAVITVSNALRNDWITHIPELLTTEKFFFIVHPFSEDLLIEPRSLFAYTMPVFTELLVDAVPSGHYVGAKKSHDYKEYQSKKAKPLYEKLLKSLGCGMLVRSRIQKVLTDFHELMGSESADLDCLYTVFPYASVTHPLRAEMIELISSEMKISVGLVSDLKNFMGVSNE